MKLLTQKMETKYLETMLGNEGQRRLETLVKTNTFITNRDHYVTNEKEIHTEPCIKLSSLMIFVSWCVKYYCTNVSCQMINKSI